MDGFLSDIPRERVVAGYRRTVRGIRAGEIARVLVAVDADRHIADKIREICAERDIPFRFAGSKSEMGEFLRLDVDCAVCGEVLSDEI